MPAVRLSMRNTREILRLRWGLGRSIRETARSCGVGTTTVHDAIARAKAAGLSWPLPPDLDDAALETRLYPPPGTAARDRAVPDFATMYRELKRRGVTLELLWQEYRQQHAENGYGYSRYCDLYRRWRGQLDLVMRQEHRAGEKLFVDYAGMPVEVIDARTGEIKTYPVFVAALGASSFTYAEACEGQDKHSWIEAHIHTYSYIGGVAAITVPDYVPRHVIGILCPTSLCGRRRVSRRRGGWRSRSGEHNDHKASSQASRASSSRQTGFRGGAAEASSGGWQSSSACCLARMLISA
jgi:transposase